MTWAAAWKLARNRWAQLAFVGVASFVAGLLVAQRPTAAPTSTPYTAAPTARAAEADKVIEPLDVQTLKPEPKVRAKIARDYREPGIVTPAVDVTDAVKTGFEGQLFGGSERFAVEILGETKVEPLPDGGTALTTIDRTTGLPKTTIKPKEGLSLRNRWEIVGGFGLLEPRPPEPGHEVAESWEKFWEAEGRWTPACRKRLCAELAAGWRKVGEEHGRAYGVIRPKLIGGR